MRGVTLVTINCKVNILFNDALNTFYLRLYKYDIGHMVKDRSLHGLLFPISNKSSFMCTIPQTG